MMQTGEYLTLVEEQRQQRVEELLKDYGFLTLAGLYWLDEGVNRFGTDPANDIVLPSKSAPNFCGHFHLEDGEVVVEVAPNVKVTRRDGGLVTLMPLRSDQQGTPDMLYLNDLAMLLLQRDHRFAIRLYDKQHAAREQFAGLRWYPVQPRYRLHADFIAYPSPKMLPIVEVIGYAYESPSPGYVQFEWEGHEYQLVAQARGERLFYNFRDATNRDSTYGAGRFLYSDLPQDGKVDLDFNLATNPFCAYTPFATCPLPPSQNQLDFRVEAGEMIYESVAP